MRCTACGTDNAPERRFCADCGAALAVACDACSAANEATARFCGQCGASLANPGALASPGLAEPPPRSWPAAERRQLTLLFCDLCGSTALSDRLDPEDMREMLESYRARCAAALARYGGTVAYYMGDGILAYFGYPTAHEDDALRAVRAALEIVPAVGRAGRRLALAVAAAAPGPHQHPYRPRRRRGDQPGQPPQRAVGRRPRAEHRCPAADAGGAGRDRGQRRDAPSAARRVRHHLAGPPPAARHRRDDRGPPGRKRAADRGRHRRRNAATGCRTLVNREAELAILADCWAQAQLGAGRAVLLSGEPGIGKSRLVRALVAGLLASAHQVLLLQCSPYFIDSPLHPVIEQIERAAGIAQADDAATRLERLDRLVGLAARAACPISSRRWPTCSGSSRTATGPWRRWRRPRSARARSRRLSDYVLSLAATRPMILLVEDLHWADPTTREWLGLLIDRLRAAPAPGV